jgi:mannose-1-phosphate guanylyltransferase / phosphomannomutase
MKVVVMAGGEGSRLRPLTSNLPKPLVPIATVPIMEHTVRLLKSQSFDEFVVTTFYLGDEIKAFFGDGRDFDVRMHYSREPIPLGTAGSVKRAEEHLQDEPFLIVSGDALTDCDFRQAVAFHKSKGALVTIILHHVQNPLEFGVVVTDGDGRITHFLEKPTWSEVISDTVNTGMYIIDPKVFEMMEPDTAYDWSQDIFPRLLESGAELFGYVMSGYWCDVGSLGQYKEAQEHLLNRLVHLPIPGELQESGISVGPNCQVDEEAVLVPPVVLGRNVKVKRGARVGPYTSVGDNCLIEEYGLVERSVLWDSVYVGNSVSIRSSIVGSRATLKKDVHLMDDAVVGDRCLLDVGTVIRPHVKLWPDKVIERGSTVTMSMVWGHRWRGNLFRELGVAGISNIEMTPDFACRLASAFGSCFPRGTQIVTSRDSSRSSRMLKRALISSLLSVGCNVLDLRSAPIPIARHFIRNSSAAAAMSVRKLPGNNRVSLIEMFDDDGGYLSKNLERKVETLFFREDYKRTDAEDIGIIEFSSRAIDEYETDFMRFVGLGPEIRQTPRVVCNFGYSAVSGMFPSLLGRIGVEAMSLNSFNDARKAPRTPEDIEAHLQELAKIVGTLQYDLGVLFLDEGERVILVDDRGEILDGHDLFATLASAILRRDPLRPILAPAHMPEKLLNWLRSQGGLVTVTKANPRALIQEASAQPKCFGGDERGGFIFSEMHPGFDAVFTVGWLVTWLAQSGQKLSEMRATMPKFPMQYESTIVHWETKGQAMRKLLDWAASGDTDLLDGVKVHTEGGTILVLPDTFEPLFHVYAEGEDQASSQRLAHEAVQRIQSFVSS